MSRDCKDFVSMGDTMSEETHDQGSQTLVTEPDMEESCKLLLPEEEAEKKELQEENSEAGDQENNSLQREFLELWEQTKITINNLRKQLEEAEAVQSFNELLLLQLQEDVSILRERVRVLEERPLEERLSSNTERLSVWRRLVRIFTPGWRRHQSSNQTSEPREQVKEDTDRRPMVCRDSQVLEEKDDDIEH